MRIDINKEVLAKYTDNITEVWSKGETKIENSLYHIHLGDWVSWYLSEMNKVDAIEIDVINFLKGLTSKGVNMPNVVFQDLGLIDYKECWEYQELRFNEILDVKKTNRKNGERQATTSYLLFCEHPHVYTLGKSGDENNLLVNEAYLKSRGATFYKINRGGDITYHGPGQIVGYPILDLDNFFTDIHKYLRLLEEAVILTLKEYNIEKRSIRRRNRCLDRCRHPKCP